MTRRFDQPLAITMWDFSWLERRWPGAGFEDWGLALDELAERGYDAVRIDAYPHLVSSDPHATWELVPAWNQTAWGAQSRTWVTVLPDLLEFISAARDRGIAVALSSWYREDTTNAQMRIKTPHDQAKIWIDTLDHIRSAGLLDAIVLVDLCNEFPGNPWSSYLYDDHEVDPMASRTQPRIREWMNDSIRELRAAYPDIALTYSFSREYDNWAEQDVSALDVLEPHVWMSHPETSDFQPTIGYHFERFDPVGFDNIVLHAKDEYFAHRPKYDGALFRTIDQMADWSRATGKALITTECWALVDYKDWPGLDWEWIKDLTELGLRRAAATGRWIGLATSNFCAPQFVGMWRDIEWHQRLTGLIKSSAIDPELRASLGGFAMQTQADQPVRPVSP